MAEEKRTQFAEVYGGRHRMAPLSDAARLLDLPAFLSGRAGLGTAAASCRQQHQQQGPAGDQAKRHRRQERKGRPKAPAIRGGAPGAWDPERHI